MRLARVSGAGAARHRTVPRPLLALVLLPLLAGCDPFQPDNPAAVRVTPESQCSNAGGTNALRRARDGSAWKVCTFRDGRVCDRGKLRIDNRCYTTVPDTAPRG